MVTYKIWMKVSKQLAPKFKILHKLLWLQKILEYHRIKYSNNINLLSFYDTSITRFFLMVSLLDNCLVKDDMDDIEQHDNKYLPKL